jgi:ParB family chromosome partitioning protein
MNEKIIPFEKRRYEAIPVDQVKVVNSRNRDREQFEMNVESIEHVGLLKPVRVNDKFVARTGYYELICGEGRLKAHRRLGRDTITAEVITCTRKEGHLQSLVENIARTKPGTMDFARELKRLRDEGWEDKQLARITCHPVKYIREYIRLIEQGEDRLLHGVEQGIFSIDFAKKVASTDDSQVQNLLMDAFDEGLVTSNNFASARKLIAARTRSNKKKTAAKEYTVTQLRQDIINTTKVKTSYVRQAQGKENRFMLLLTGLNLLWKDEAFLECLQEQDLLERPVLSGDFGYES